MLIPYHTAQRSSPCWRLSLPAGLSHLREASERLVTAAAVLPEQFSAPAGSADPPCGEVALMRAVLEEALHCLQHQSRKSGRRAQRLTREAEAWFFTDDYHCLFSFMNIRAVLGLDSEYIRWGIRQWREQGTAAPQKPSRLIVPGHRPLKRAA